MALALAGVVVVARDVGSGPSLASVRANGVAVIEPGEPALTGQVALDGAPSAIAAGAGAVWVSDEDHGVVSRLDKETFTIRQTIPVGHGPSAIAVARDRVWVANRQDGTLSVISPQTNAVVDRIPVGRTVDGVCVGSGAVWVASPFDHAVVRLDPESGRKTATVRLDSQPSRAGLRRRRRMGEQPVLGHRDRDQRQGGRAGEHDPGRAAAPPPSRSARTRSGSATRPTGRSRGSIRGAAP